MFTIGLDFKIEMAHYHSKSQNQICSAIHGHSQRVEAVFNIEELNNSGIACDYIALESTFSNYIMSLDHALLVNSSSEHYEYLKKNFPRVITINNQDPTTEIVAKLIYDYIFEKLSNGIESISNGVRYCIQPSEVNIEYVKVWETERMWTKYSK